MIEQISAIIDPRYLVMGITAVVVLSVIALFVRKFIRDQRRDKYLKALVSKTEAASKRAMSVILDAEARAMKGGGRDQTYQFEAVNWFAIRRDLKRASLPQLPILPFLVAGGLSYLIAAIIIAAPTEIYPLWAVSLAIYGPVFLMVRYGLIGMRMDQQRMKMMDQLVIFIESVQRAVTVGTAPDEAVAEAIRDTEQPLRENLVAIKDLLDLGYDFIDAINMAADKVNLPEFDIFAASLTAQSTTGGSVGEVLKEVVEISRARMQLTKKIATMTAEGRFNALLLGALPIGLTMYLRYGQPDLAEAVWGVQWGHWLYFAHLGMAVFGAWLAMKIAKITV